jgi:cytochrome c peroxidase
MALPWSEAARRLASHRGYRSAFRKAFGGREIDSLLVARALAQFQRTLVSGGSRFDRWKAGRLAFTAEEELGYAVFNSEAGDCAACHTEPFFTNFSFANIGLDSAIEGTGRGGHSGNATEMGQWKVPSLRNLAFTAPYMRDGRFATLEEVLDFYESGGSFTATLDPLIRNPDNPDAKFPGRKGLGLTETQRKALLAFLAALDDSAFATAVPPRGP